MYTDMENSGRDPCRFIRPSHTKLHDHQLIYVGARFRLGDRLDVGRLPVLAPERRGDLQFVGRLDEAAEVVADDLGRAR